MDRRSWLWRRKSSEKSPGETESSGSISSHSERFSDDQVYAAHNSQSPEVTSKAAPSDEETNDKSLREKLSLALLNISAKEDLVKQHAKVAEEAVAGWEKAEEEVLTLKHKCSALEDRVGHLDGALKECVRQLRQGREEQEQRIREAIGKKTYEWESTKFELEAQITQLQAKLKEPDLELSSRLEASEKELLVRTIERDLSTEAAEAASKQHLEDMRKLAKLEAECKRLSKSSTTTDSKSSFAASSVCIESIIDSHSDHTTNKPHSIEIGLMDDFLEMERLAAMEEDTGSESYPISDQETSTESISRAELEAMIHRTKKMEEEKAELEVSLTLVHNQLEEDESKLRALQAQLAQTIESNVSLEKQLNASNMNTEAAESQLRIVQAEIEDLHSRIASLEEELQKERDFSTTTLAKCEKLEDELKRESSSASESLAKYRKLEAEVLGMKQGAELHQEKELAVAASKFAECQKTIASLGRQLKSLASLEDLLIDEKSPELSPQALKCHHEHQLLSSPEKINDKEPPLPVKANLEPEKIENGMVKRLPRGRSRFRKERFRD